MAEKVITNEQLMNYLNSDPKFGIQFIVQNQPNIVIDRLKEAGYDKAHTPESAYTLLSGLYDIDPNKVGEILNDIPYNNTAENYTGGLQEYFDTESETNTREQSGLWGGILTGVGGLLSGIGMGISGQQGLTNQTQQQLLFEQQRQAELERQRRNRNALIWGVVAVLVLIVIVALYNSSKNKS